MQTVSYRILLFSLAFWILLNLLHPFFMQLITIHLWSRQLSTKLFLRVSILIWYYSFCCLFDRLVKKGRSILVCIFEVDRAIEIYLLFFVSDSTITLQKRIVFIKLRHICFVGLIVMGISLGLRWTLRCMSCWLILLRDHYQSLVLIGSLWWDQCCLILHKQLLLSRLRFSSLTASNTPLYAFKAMFVHSRFICFVFLSWGRINDIFILKTFFRRVTNLHVFFRFNTLWLIYLKSALLNGSRLRLHAREGFIHYYWSNLWFWLINLGLVLLVQKHIVILTVVSQIL